jgi:biopolymer transport protein ExbB/TolQ
MTLADIIILSIVVLFICAMTAVFARGIHRLNKQQEALRAERIERRIKAEELRRKQQEAAEREFDESMRKLYEKLQYVQQQQERRQYTPARKRVVTRGDVRRARELLEDYGGYRDAVKQTHPDYGGNAADFDAVVKAKRLVDRFPHVI